MFISNKPNTPSAPAVNRCVMQHYDWRCWVAMTTGKLYRLWPVFTSNQVTAELASLGLSVYFKLLMRNENRHKWDNSCQADSRGIKSNNVTMNSRDLIIWSQKFYWKVFKDFIADVGFKINLNLWDRWGLFSNSETREILYYFLKTWVNFHLNYLI